LLFHVAHNECRRNLHYLRWDQSLLWNESFYLTVKYYLHFLIKRYIHVKPAKKPFYVPYCLLFPPIFEHLQYTDGQIVPARILHEAHPLLFHLKFLKKPFLREYLYAKEGSWWMAKRNLCAHSFPHSPPELLHHRDLLPRDVY